MRCEGPTRTVSDIALSITPYRTFVYSGTFVPGSEELLLHGGHALLKPVLEGDVAGEGDALRGLAHRNGTGDFKVAPAGRVLVVQVPRPRGRADGSYVDD